MNNVNQGIVMPVQLRNRSLGIKATVIASDMLLQRNKLERLEKESEKREKNRVTFSPIMEMAQQDMVLNISTIASLSSSYDFEDMESFDEKMRLSPVPLSPKHQEMLSKTMYENVIDNI